MVRSRSYIKLFIVGKKYADSDVQQHRTRDDDPYDNLDLEDTSR